MSAIGVVFPAAFKGDDLVKRPHCTLIYLGEVGQVWFRKHQVEKAVDRLIRVASPMRVRVESVELFGRGNITGLKLDRYALDSYRRMIDIELGYVGIRSASQYTYTPHVSVFKHEEAKEPQLPDGFHVPPYVYLDKPTLWWNE